MIDFFDVQPKTLYNGLTVTDITKQIDIISSLDRYTVNIKIDPQETLNDVAYRLYGDDRLFWVLQELNKGLVFSPMLYEEDFLKYMQKYNVTCLLPNGGITSIINLNRNSQFAIDVYEYDIYEYNATTNKIGDQDINGNTLYINDELVRVYVNGTRLSDEFYDIEVDEITDMQYINIDSNKVNTNDSVVIRLYTPVEISKIDIVRDQIVLDREISKTLVVEMTNSTGQVSDITSRMTPIMYRDAIHHYNFNGLAYNSKPVNAPDTKLYSYTWEEYEYAVNEEKRNIKAINPIYKSELIRIIQDKMEELDV